MLTLPARPSVTPDPAGASATRDPDLRGLVEPRHGPDPRGPETHRHEVLAAKRGTPRFPAVGGSCQPRAVSTTQGTPGVTGRAGRPGFSPAPCLWGDPGHPHWQPLGLTGHTLHGPPWLPRLEGRCHARGLALALTGVACGAGEGTQGLSVLGKGSATDPCGLLWPPDFCPREQGLFSLKEPVGGGLELEAPGMEAWGRPGSPGLAGSCLLAPSPQAQGALGLRGNGVARAGVCSPPLALGICLEGWGGASCCPLVRPDGSSAGSPPHGDRRLCLPLTGDHC